MPFSAKIIWPPMLLKLATLSWTKLYTRLTHKYHKLHQMRFTFFYGNVLPLAQLREQCLIFQQNASCVVSCLQMMNALLLLVLLQPMTVHLPLPVRHHPDAESQQNQCWQRTMEILCAAEHDINSLNCCKDQFFLQTKHHKKICCFIKTLLYEEP